MKKLYSLSDDAHRHSGEEGRQGSRLDGTRHRRTIPRREIGGLDEQ